MTPPTTRLRTIVTTDPELDDANSLVRFLLYSNEIDVQGLIYASSQFHWRGDDKGTTFFHEDRNDKVPLARLRWGDDERFIDEVVDLYGEVADTLRVHDPRYPDVDSLREVIRWGNIAFEGDISEATPGSDLIMERLLDDDPRPLYVQLWAGPSTLARALLSIEERYAATEEWTRVRAWVTGRLIVSKFASQDDTYEEYIAPRWPEVEVREVATLTWGYFARVVVADEHAHLMGPEWTRENVLSRAPLGAHYRVWGDGRSMSGDDIDYFGIVADQDELERRGFRVWCPPEEPGSWISEGDSSNFMNLIANGLRAHERPHFGGWGGRQFRSATRPNEYLSSLAHDRDERGHQPRDWSSARWFADAQYDFAARLHWSVEPDITAANHPPTVIPRTALDVSAAPGDEIAMAVDASDPDGDAISIAWRQDADAAPRAPRAVLASEGDSATLTVPLDARAGDEYHVLAEVRDDGTPSLARYARFVITAI